MTTRKWPPDSSKSGFLKRADFNGRVDEAIVILSGVNTSSEDVRGVAMCQPSGRWLKCTVNWRGPRVHGIHQDLREIQKRMMRS